MKNSCLTQMSIEFRRMAIFTMESDFLNRSKNLKAKKIIVIDKKVFLAFPIHKA